LLGQLESAESVVIADMEAGIGAFGRMDKGAFDLALVVTDSSAKAIEVAQRAREIALERGLGPLAFVANKVIDERDLELISKGLSVDVADLDVVPHDQAVLAADRDGLSPVDVGGASPAVAAISRIAERI
jgi:CO dehydrogenase nickel-insertion accessory protein CooC1